MQRPFASCWERATVRSLGTTFLADVGLACALFNRAGCMSAGLDHTAGDIGHSDMVSFPDSNVGSQVDAKHQPFVPDMRIQE